MKKGYCNCQTKLTNGRNYIWQNKWQLVECKDDSICVLCGYYTLDKIPDMEKLFRKPNKRNVKYDIDSHSLEI